MWIAIGVFAGVAAIVVIVWGVVEGLQAEKSIPLWRQRRGGAVKAAPTEEFE
jgi:hypothetical protein